MRDIVTIFAAGLLMTAYALTAPTIVEAVQPPAPVSQKAFAQRLRPVEGNAPVSAVSGARMDRVVEERAAALPFFAQY